MRCDSKKPAKGALAINGVVTQKTINFCGKVSSSCLLLLFLFFPSFSTAPTGTAVTITLELCALNVDFQISYPDLINFHCFADITERGGLEVKGEPKTVKRG
jgi:hypothetical protein